MKKILCDMHIHSQSSHDSVSPVSVTAKACVEKGVSAFAITDHCDIQYYESQNVPAIVNSSVLETEEAAREFLGKIKILKGVEIGEGIWNTDYTDKILSSHDFDVVISSVHAGQCTMLSNFTGKISSNNIIDIFYYWQTLLI